MHFTEGQLREYENMMKEKPGYDRRPIKKMKEQDCKECMSFDEHCGKCRKKKCSQSDN